MEYVPIVQEQLILCPGCGAPTPPNAANMCVSCIRNEVDITEGIPKQATIHFCKNCERYLQPPDNWVVAQLESRELLTLCLKKLKGLNKVRLVDAGFIWTEPHSRRIKVKLTIQKEVYANTILQQIFEVEYVVSSQQCIDCTREAAQNTWKAVVQDTTNIRETKDGIDFYFGQRAHAIKMVDFLSAVVPLRFKTSEQLISTDTQSSTSNYKFTYSAEIAPTCKDDLVCIPKKMTNSLGQVGQLLICSRISNTIHMIDVSTLNHCDIPGNVFWRQPFKSLASAASLIEYYVQDVEPLGPVRGKYVLADIHVQRMADVERNGDIYITRSHLGAILNPGDTVLGYDLTHSNYNNDEFDKLNRGSLPDVILVRKTYPARRKKNKGRNWKLQQMGKEVDEMLPRKQDQARIENDMELFMRDIEEDPEFRANINIFKNLKAPPSNAMVTDTDTEDAEEEEDFPEISLEEMLDEMQLQDGNSDDDEADDTEMAM